MTRNEIVECSVLNFRASFSGRKYGVTRCTNDQDMARIGLFHNKLGGDHTQDSQLNKPVVYFMPY